MPSTTTTSKSVDFKELLSHSKEYGFVFPSSELYDGLSAVYDYGQVGALLKANLKNLWWKTMTQFHDNVVGIDSSIFMHPTIWKASGHVDSFNDPMVDNRDSNKRYRADVLIEEKAAEYEAAGDQEAAKAIIKILVDGLTSGDLASIRQALIDHKIVCAVSGTANWTDVRQFNLMFSTQIGSVSEESDLIYLRPETAQGIFVNYLNVQKTGRMKVPFGIAQIGKAFRNEIVARQFIFRMREFEQMEMQFFIRPGTEDTWYAMWKEQRMKWHQALGINPAHLRYHDHDKLAHYAKAAVDIEYKFPFGFKEMEGIHSRSDFDLKRHQEFSGKKIQYFDPEINQNYTPFVIETSVGADRLFLAVLAEAFTKTTTTEEDGSTKERTYLDFAPPIAPIKAAILPLVKKDGLAEYARNIFQDWKFDFECQYEEKDSIGKRYTRQDLIGTPFCVVVDYDSMADGSVTIRQRNDGSQTRKSIAEAKQYIAEATSVKNILKLL